MTLVLVGTADCPECPNTFIGRWTGSFLEEFMCKQCGYLFVAEWQGFRFENEMMRYYE